MKNINKIFFICFVAIVGVIAVFMAYEMSTSSEAKMRRDKLSKTLYNDVPSYKEDGTSPSSSMGSSVSESNDRSPKKLLEELNDTEDDSQKDLEDIKTEAAQL